MAVRAEVSAAVREAPVSARAVLAAAVPAVEPVVVSALARVALGGPAVAPVLEGELVEVRAPVADWAERAATVVRLAALAPDPRQGPLARPGW